MNYYYFIIGQIKYKKFNKKFSRVSVTTNVNINIHLCRHVHFNLRCIYSLSII